MPYQNQSGMHQFDTVRLRKHNVYSEIETATSLIQDLLYASHCSPQLPTIKNSYGIKFLTWQWSATTAGANWFTASARFLIDSTMIVSLSQLLLRFIPVKIFRHNLEERATDCIAPDLSPLWPTWKDESTWWSRWVTGDSCSWVACLRQVFADQRGAHEKLGFHPTSIATGNPVEANPFRLKVAVCFSYILQCIHSVRIRVQSLESRCI